MSGRATAASSSGDGRSCSADEEEEEEGPRLFSARSAKRLCTMAPSRCCAVTIASKRARPLPLSIDTGTIAVVNACGGLVVI